MIVITATKLRNNLFALLDKVSQGEIIAIKRNGEEIARIVPVSKKDWRDNTTIKPKLKVPQEEAFKSIKDIWKDYI